MCEASIREALDEPVTLVAHDPAWAEAFQRERTRLLERFGGRLLEVRHIGSTAVPGLAAKPVIDLLGGVTTMSEAHSLVPELCGFGYAFHEAGNRTFADRQWLFRERDGHRTHHLHLVVHAGKAWQDRVRFREMLQANAELRTRYERLKRELAARFGRERERYTELKGVFIRAALDGS